MFTQIYSIQTKEEALACIEAGADRIGLLVGVKGGKFPCSITEEKAKEIFDAIGNKAVRVLISVEFTADAVLAQTKRLMPDVLHLCANFEGSPAFAERLRREIPGVRLMEAVGITGPESLEDAKKKASYADILILDSVSKTVPGVGAAGVTNDWNLDREIVEAVSGTPVILAGGLGPDNVLAAIEAVHPDGVDSLTKTSDQENGVLVRKNIDLVRRFCELAHSVNLP
jgi:phosphoribosylanthranilate isomerase